MAENKKSFILYADQIGLFSKLNDAKAGRLIKMIFDYVNDKNPSTDDLLLEVAFEPIKLQLKRDLKDWEKTKSERSDSGKLGNLKKWHKDLYDKVNTGEITITEAEKEVNNRKTSLCDNSDSLIIANVAKVAVNDNVTVTDTVSVTKRAKALVVAKATTDRPSRKDYEKVIEENTGKDTNTVVSVLKEFLSKRPDFVEPYRDYWNIAVSKTNIPQCSVVNDSRGKKLKTRLMEPAFDFIEIIRKVRESNKLKHDSSWFSFDWVFENDKNYLKILEGNYGQ